MAQIILNKNACVGFGACARACPFAAIEMRGQYPEILDACRVCGCACALSLWRALKRKKSPAKRRIFRNIRGFSCSRKSQTASRIPWCWNCWARRARCWARGKSPCARWSPAKTPWIARGRCATGARMKCCSHDSPNFPCSARTLIDALEDRMAYKPAAVLVGATAWAARSPRVAAIAENPASPRTARA